MSGEANHDTVSGEANQDAVSELQAAIRVVKGNPSDQEIAALVAVLSAAAASSSAPVTDSRPPELWGDPSSMHRTFAPYSPYSFAASRRY
ncbi:acyl-CoA carboxylase subunit epsilon [Rhodococcoides kyotonense]|uniref:Acyl-CoA carboxylase epsilon subunit n=1 Tax=Rhodococcoides kyotonense TaxID=398843 RepID=A0A239LUX8_9NOCA|nr:acyl-CoA carboxylase subunit epsilon [Rhodococcus kyotonensis]SNT34477.1 Acyl-CoA carboxylase epsilon subunit [Rhodococcus kyotonensis]